MTKPIMEYDQVKEISVKHNALHGTDGKLQEVENIFETETVLYDELYEYFQSDMPYDVAKGRADIMPDEWIADKLDELGLVYDEQAEHEFNEDYAQRKSDGQVEG